MNQTQTFNNSEDARLFSRSVGGSIAAIGGKYIVTYRVAGAAGGTNNGTNTGTNSPYDPTKGVDYAKLSYEDAKRSANATAIGTLVGAFNQYGLSGLAPWIISQIKAGKPASEVAINIRKTKEYQERFPAMSVLAKAGKAIDESTYIGYERAYDEVFSAAGIGGYTKKPKDYYFWITNNISPTQVGERVNAATTLINNSNPNALDAFQKFYGIGKKDLLAFYLSPKQKGPELIKKAQIAMTSGVGATFGVNVSEGFGRSIIDAGLGNQAPEAFAKAAETKEELTRLASIGQGSLTTDQIVEANLGMGASSSKIVTGLASQERGRFSGRGTGKSMINQNVSGSY
jgi:hypothetical protein